MYLMIYERNYKEFNTANKAGANGKTEIKFYCLLFGLGHDRQCKGHLPSKLKSEKSRDTAHSCCVTHRNNAGSSSQLTDGGALMSSAPVILPRERYKQRG